MAKSIAESMAFKKQATTLTTLSEVIFEGNARPDCCSMPGMREYGSGCQDHRQDGMMRWITHIQRNQIEQGAKRTHASKTNLKKTDQQQMDHQKKWLNQFCCELQLKPVHSTTTGRHKSNTAKRFVLQTTEVFARQSKAKLPKMD